jgi:CTP:molybdopterin cytidylyltransferase MocA
VQVAGLLLAAGAGRRFGGPKALVEVDGEPLVRRGARRLRAGGCSPVVVVLGAAAAQARAALHGAGSPDDVVTVVAEGWQAGIGASLGAGLAHLAGTGADAVVIALVDQPEVGPGAVERLIAAFTAGAGPTVDARPGADAAVATYAGAPRNPVLLARPVWADVARCARGDIGARAWLRAHPDRVIAVPCDGTGVPDDIDSPADLARARRRAAGP